MKNVLKKSLYICTDRIALLLSHLFLPLFYRISIFDEHNVLQKAESPVILVSNHKSTLDILFVTMPISLRSKLLPVRFMGEVQHFGDPILEFLRKIGIISFVFAISGTFPSKRGAGVDRAIELPLQLLKDGQTVFIFPEGRRVQEEGIGPFKRGAAALAIKSGVPVLPASIAFSKNNGRTDVRIAFGKMFTVPPSFSYDEGTAHIREKVVELYNNSLPINDA